MYLHTWQNMTHFVCFRTPSFGQKIRVSSDVSTRTCLLSLSSLYDPFSYEREGHFSLTIPSPPFAPSDRAILVELLKPTRAIYLPAVEGESIGNSAFSCLTFLGKGDGCLYWTLLNACEDSLECHVISSITFVLRSLDKYAFLCRCTTEIRRRG